MGDKRTGKDQADFRQTASQRDSVAGQMIMSATVGGTCGGALTEAPSVYGEVTPDWSSSLNLPGSKRQQIWKVGIATDIGPFAASGSCKVVVGIKLQPIEKNGTSNLELQLPPGVYNLELSCSDPNSPMSYGCKGTPGLASYKNQKYEIRIDANRSSVPRAQEAAAAPARR